MNKEQLRKVKEEFEKKFFTEMEFPNNEKIPVLFTTERRMILWQWIESKLSEAEKWISISERLPEEGKSVLTYNHSGDRYALRRYFDNQWFRLTGESTMNVFLEEEKITHWMPLPNPPKRGEINK